MFFAKFKLYLFSQKRKLLRCFRPASWFATAKRGAHSATVGGCYWHPPPRSYLFLLLFLRSRSFLASTSLSLVSTLIRWHVCKMARCVSGIHFHVCQKSNESWAKLFEQGRAFALPHTTTPVRPSAFPPHPPDSQLPLVHLYILSVWYSDSNLWEIACQRTRKAAFCVF